MPSDSQMFGSFWVPETKIMGQLGGTPILTSHPGLIRRRMKGVGEPNPKSFKVRRKKVTTRNCLQVWLVVSTPLKNMKVNFDDYSQCMGK